MSEIFGEHKQDLNEVRRLCLICHGLDLTSDKLFSDSTYENALSATKEVFHSLVSGKMLNLAVAIRVNIYQGKMGEEGMVSLSNCAFYYDDEKLVEEDITIKDVCDKIIHADTISKEAISPEILGDSKMTMQLKGKYHGRPWTLDLSIEHFTEAVLNYLDQLEVNHA